MSKRIFMIAGPNGAGKTMMALKLIRKVSTLDEFINADEIAYGLSPLQAQDMAVTAGKLMIRRFRELLENQKSFAFETTGAGTNYLAYLKRAKAEGYQIKLIYLWLSSPEQAIERVAQRVLQGGHDVPPETIRRRYYVGLKNLLEYYLPLVDSAVILNNSIKELNAVIASKKVGGCLKITDSSVWGKIQRLVYEQVR